MTKPNSLGYGSTASRSSRPPSTKSSRSIASHSSRSPRRTTEQTPLLASTSDNHHDPEEEDTDHLEHSLSQSALLRSLAGTKATINETARRWPSIIALILLCAAVVLIIIAAFITPEAFEEYATQAADFKPTKLALDGMTPTGVRVLVEGDFAIDSTKVTKKSVRDFGRFGTWIAREVESGPATIDVYLPDYDNILIGSAKIPGIKVNIQDGHVNHLKFVTDLEPRSFDGVRNIINDWLEGRLGDVSVLGKAKVPLRSGIVSLGEQLIVQSLKFGGNNVPSLPRFDITKLKFHELYDGKGGMQADATIMVENEFPVDVSIPPIGVSLLVENCAPTDPYIKVGEATTGGIHVKPKKDVRVDVVGKVRELPDALTTACPNSQKSPLDVFLSGYIHGEATTVYVNCCNFPDPNTPAWMKDLTDITVPVPFKASSMDHLIRNFSLTNVHFFLPDLLAEPDTPESEPKISATVQALVNLPKEMNLPLNVTQVRADADVFYHGKKLGKLDLQKWQEANSTRVEGHDEELAALLVQANVEKVPLKILDEDLFAEVASAIFFGGKSVLLGIKAAVDVKMETPIGEFAVTQIPAEGIIPVKPMSGGKFSDLAPSVKDLRIVNTDTNALTIQAKINFTNPTQYAATIPYASINILCNDTVLGQGIAKNIAITPGNNTNILVEAIWEPLSLGGKNGLAVGKELLSQYLSGYNTTVTLRTHRGTIPSQPGLGQALSIFKIDVPAPKLHTPNGPDGDDEKDETGFIEKATVHIMSSTAVFTLASPLTSTIIYIDRINATAFYEVDPVGRIIYDLPFAVKPGISDTPHIPLQWDLNSVGYEAVKKAIGGKLKLDAYAELGVRIGRWKQDIWVHGKGIGAYIRL